MPTYISKSMNLIQRQHGGRRIVDGRRQGLVGDVHHDAKCETRILLHRALGTNGDTGTQCVGIDGTTAAAYAKQRIAPGHKIAHLRHQLDHGVSTFRHRQQIALAKRQHDARLPDVLDRHHVGVRSPSPTGSIGQPAPERLDDMQRAHIRRVLEGCGWKIDGKGHAAEKLGLNPSTLRSWMDRLGIARPARAR